MLKRVALAIAVLVVILAPLFLIDGLIGRWGGVADIRFPQLPPTPLISLPSVELTLGWAIIIMIVGALTRIVSGIFGIEGRWRVPAFGFLLVVAYLAMQLHGLTSIGRGVQSTMRDMLSPSVPQIVKANFTSNSGDILLIKLAPEQVAMATGIHQNEAVWFCLVVSPADVTALLGTGPYGAYRPASLNAGEWLPSQAVQNYFRNQGRPIELRVSRVVSVNVVENWV